MGQPVKVDESFIAKLLTFDIKNRALWALLKRRLTKERNRLAKQPTVVILSLGCGLSEETRVLSAFFGGNEYNAPSSKVKIFGIDRDPALIETAGALAELPSPTEPMESYVVAPTCTFLAGDATQLGQYPALPEKADIVWLRHQFLASDILEKKQTWSTILVQALGRVADYGLLLLTSYRESENQLLIDALKALPCQVLGNYLNEEPISQELPHMPDSYFDKYLTIARKASTGPSKK